MPFLPPPMPPAFRARRRSPAAALVVLLALSGCTLPMPPADLGFVTRWTRTHYALARAERLSPPVASRLTAYAAVALYEGWAAFSDSLRSLAGQLNGLDALPRPRREERYDPALVALEAQTVVLRALYQEGFASTQVAISALHDSRSATIPRWWRWRRRRCFSARSTRRASPRPRSRSPRSTTRGALRSRAGGAGGADGG